MKRLVGDAATQQNYARLCVLGCPHRSLFQPLQASWQVLAPSTSVSTVACVLDCASVLSPCSRRYHQERTAKAVWPVLGSLANAAKNTSKRSRCPARPLAGTSRSVAELDGTPTLDQVNVDKRPATGSHDVRCHLLFAGVDHRAGAGRGPKLEGPFPRLAGVVLRAKPHAQAAHHRPHFRCSHWAAVARRRRPLGNPTQHHRQVCQAGVGPAGLIRCVRQQ